VDCPSPRKDDKDRAAMNVFFEEDGGFKVARIMEDIGTSLQVEAVTGKRSKIKSNAVLLRFATALNDLLPQAEALAAEIDLDFLYEVCGPSEFGFEELALEYFGHPPSAPEAAACAMKLHGAPMYFYKRGKGRYQKAPGENLKAALASLERKRREAVEMEIWVSQLKSGVLPEAMRPHINQLLYKPDRNTLIAKACEKAVAESGQNLPELFHAAGAWSHHRSAPHMAQHDFHVGKFLSEYFPKGTTPAVELTVTPPSNLPCTSLRGYSIDDAATIEIDDAFSFQQLDASRIEIGIHIAAPALYFAADSAVDAYAKSRLSTVYYPGSKITMLPDEAVEAATLKEGRDCPVVSLYALFDSTSNALVSVRSAVEQIHIAKNLRLHELELWLTDSVVSDPTAKVEQEFGTELVKMFAIATALKDRRGAKDNIDYVDYNFDIDEDGTTVNIWQRVRGSPVDTIVAEFMILANSEWGKLLAENNVAGIYRAQQNMKTRMTTDALPHEGLGVAHYAWSSSPLRRYVDLINQRQLIALIQGTTPLYPRRSPVLSEIARTFDLTYDAYAEFQRNMERFWCLRYLEQSGRTSFEATVIRDELIRGTDLPLIVRLKAPANLPAKTPVTVNVEAIDYWSIGGAFSLPSPPTEVPQAK
jgi:exoribonuclease-2